jgi:hypothetical protein
MKPIPDTKLRRMALATALRSGKYQQTCHFLRSIEFDSKGPREMHCVWGVAIELWARATERMFCQGESGRGEYPTKEVRDWYGISLKRANTMMHHNDGGLSFETLADRLELIP